MGARQQFAEANVWTEDEIAARPTAILGLPVAIPANGDFANSQPSGLRLALKRALDLSVALILLVALAPLMALIAFLIKLDSKGPVLFRQTRLGQSGKPFEIFKFRSMTVLEDGEDVVQVRRNDDRVTRVGHFIRRSSLDELPQLINVISGEMSLVGPRPHAVAHDRLYAGLIEGYDLRQLVKPGITGWAQVNGARGETPAIEDMKKRVLLDIWYARHASLRLDFRILARTPLAVLSQRNAH